MLWSPRDLQKWYKCTVIVKQPYLCHVSVVTVSVWHPNSHCSHKADLSSAKKAPEFHSSPWLSLEHWDLQCTLQPVAHTGTRKQRRKKPIPTQRVKKNGIRERASQNSLMALRNCGILYKEREREPIRGERALPPYCLEDANNFSVRSDR